MMAKQMTWERALVRTGILFEKEGEALLFPLGNRQNLQLPEMMLQELGVADCGLHDAFRAMCSRSG